MKHHQHQLISGEIETDWLAAGVQACPDQVVLSDGDSGRHWTWSALWTATQRLAHYLRSQHGIGHGDRIAIHARNRIEHFPLFFAAQRLGAILVPLNFRLGLRELDLVLRDAAPRLVLAEMPSPELRGLLEIALGAGGALWEFDGPGGVGAISTGGELPYGSLPFAGRFEDPAMILYTSGTTGRMKGVVVSNRMIAWNSLNTGLTLGLTEKDAVVNFLPFFHTGAWNVLALPLIHHRGRVIFTSRFDPDRVLQLTSEHRATMIFGVPTTMALMAECPSFGPADLAVVRYALVGGEPMPEPLIMKWHERGVAIRQGYGLTEFGPNVFSLPDRDAARKRGSIGFPNLYCRVRMRDGSGNIIAGAGEGELQVSGPMMMSGYWNNPEESGRVMHEGWLSTGDLVRRDEEGYWYVTGRLKDMYISGGENVYPAEVERVLMEDPSVAAAAVVGVPDARWGEVGKAFVVCRPGSSIDLSQLHRRAAGGLARYKLPRYYEVVEELPLTDSGKVRKHALPREACGHAPTELLMHGGPA